MYKINHIYGIFPYFYWSLSAPFYTVDNRWPCSAHMVKMKLLEKRDIKWVRWVMCSIIMNHSDSLPKFRPSSASFEPWPWQTQKWQKIKSQNCVVRLKNVHYTILWLTQSGRSQKRSAFGATWQGSLLRSSNLLMLKGSGSNKIFPACHSEASRKVVWRIYSFGSRSAFS